MIENEGPSIFKIMVYCCSRVPSLHAVCGNRMRAVKMMNFSLKVMELCIKMMDIAFKMMELHLK